MVEAVNRADYSVPDDVLVQILSDGEVVLLNLVTEAYFGLDEVGAGLFGLLQEDVSLNDAHQRLLEEYDVDGDTLRSDLEDLVSELIRHGLLAKLAG